VVRKRCLGPIISPSKKVVRVGWSSVRPGGVLADWLVVGVGDCIEGRRGGDTLYAQVAAEEGLGHVDVFDFDLDVVDLAV